MPDAVVTALGAQRRQELSVTERIVEYLGPLRMLLLLDNCEHVTAPVARLVTAVAGRCAGVTILATSREPLGVDGERVRPVRPLPVPTPGAHRPGCRGGQRRGAAVRRARGRSLERTSTLDASNAAAVAELCRGLDGLPLALELAASRLRAMSPAEIVARLDTRFGLLGGGRAAAPDRHRTLRALVDWSYELLDEAERRVFTRVSVFSGPFTLDAVEAVCPEPDVAGVVAGLVDRSMLTADTRATPTRYTLLETLRAYGRERLAATGAEDTVRRAHAEHAVAVAEAAELGAARPGRGPLDRRAGADHRRPARGAPVGPRPRPRPGRAAVGRAGVVREVPPAIGGAGVGRAGLRGRRPRPRSQGRQAGRGARGGRCRSPHAWRLRPRRRARRPGNATPRTTPTCATR